MPFAKIWAPMRSPSSKENCSAGPLNCDIRADYEIEQGLEWLAQFGDQLYAYALQRVRCLEVAEDIVQETFLTAISSAETFESKSSPETWLMGILRHKLADHYRRKSRYQSLIQVEPDSAERFFKQELDTIESSHNQRWSDPDSAIEQAEFQSVVTNCVNDLPDLVRQAFEFRVVDRLDTNEVCELLGISSNNLAARLYRARAYVRDCLARRWF